MILARLKVGPSPLTRASRGRGPRGYAWGPVRYAAGRDRRRLADAALSFRHTSEPFALLKEYALPLLQRTLTADVTAFYQLGFDDERIRLERLVGAGLSQDDFEGLRPVLEVAPAHRWGYFEPLRPQGAQRNRPLTRRQLLTVQPGADESPALKAWHGRVGLSGADQLRVLLCAGPRLLGWLGAFRREPFTRDERALLGALVTPVRDALLREERHLGERLALRALPAALEAIGAPAFVVERGRLAHVNGAGHAALALDGALKAEVLDAVRSSLAPARFSVTTLSEPGAPPCHLVVLEARPADSASTLARHAATWKLTAREAQVLRLLAEGHPNKHIAVALGCAVATVEIHVSRLLAKSHSGSRAALVARCWRPLPDAPGPRGPTRT